MNSVYVKRSDEDEDESRQSNALQVRVIYSVVSADDGAEVRIEEQTTISGR